MRASIVTIAACLALAACGRGGESQTNAAQAGENLTANDITANDTTAIDAATGDAANMAEDVEYTFNDADENATGNAGEARSNADDEEDEPGNADTTQGNAL